MDTVVSKKFVTCITSNFSYATLDFSHQLTTCGFLKINEKSAIFLLLREIIIYPLGVGETWCQKVAYVRQASHANCREALHGWTYFIS